MNCCKFGLSKNDTMHLLKELMSVKRIESVVLEYCPSGFLFLKNKGVNYRVDKTQKLTDGSSMMTEYGNIFAVNIGVHGMFDNYYVDDMDFAKVVWVFEHADSRYEQDLIVACINKELHPEYCSSFRCLDDVDLSYDTVVLHRYDELIQADNISNSLYEQRYRETYERNFWSIK